MKLFKMIKSIMQIIFIAILIVYLILSSLQIRSTVTIIIFSVLLGVCGAIYLTFTIVVEIQERRLHKADKNNNNSDNITNK